VDLLKIEALSRRSAKTACLISIALLFAMLASSTSSLGEEKYSGAALEWSLESPLPSKVETGEQFTILVKLTNEGTVDLSGGNKTTVEIVYKAKPLDSELVTLGKGKAITLTFTIKIADEGTDDIELNSYFRHGIVNLYNEQGEPTKILGPVEAEFIEEPFNWTPVIIIAVVAVAGVGVYILMSKRKKKAEEEKRIVDEARRKELIRKKEQEIAKKIVVRQIAGKHPRDYYLLRRQKYAVLRPSGMTSSGLNILKRHKTKKELEEEERLICPKCGTELAEEGAECPRCNASEKVESVRHMIRTYKSRTEADFADAEVLLRKAEHRLNWSDYSMAREIVEQAEGRMEEIWDASEKGEAVESKVIEYSEAKGPSLDAKVIGLEGEADMTTQAAEVEAEAAAIQSDEPVGEPCPECGTSMDDDECLLCGFSERLDACWAIIEMADMDGADMDEIKDLCRKANDAKERGSDELAIRYIRRASNMADEDYHSHAKSKTEGIIRFTRALVEQVKTLGEDVSMAEQMLSKAEDAMGEGEYEGARSMAAKADGYLKQMKEDSFRKRISELLPEVEAGAASNADVATLLGKAKKLIDAKELEGAVDILEMAQGKL
jgi:ssDNA-binding Zn-finger/Zn-ribbon topoisomerase 1